MRVMGREKEAVPEVLCDVVLTDEGCPLLTLSGKLECGKQGFTANRRSDSDQENQLP